MRYMSGRGNWESCGGENVRVRLEPFHLNWPEPVLLGRPERAKGKPLELSQVACCLSCVLFFSYEAIITVMYSLVQGGAFLLY